MTWSVDQTIVKMKKKNQIIVTVMMWGDPNLSTTEIWNIGSKAFERILQFVRRKISLVEFP